VNVDDAKGAELAAELTAEVGGGRVLDLWTVSTQGPARLQAQALRYVDGGLAFDLLEAGAAEAVAVRSTLIGDYNAHNLLVVLGGLRALGVPLADAVAVVPQLTPVPGRMQRVGNRTLEVVVDYAHTPDALDKALAALRPLAQARGGQLWCVFGCGGDRDTAKRPLMGAIAGERADQVVLTSDNPRSEAPEAILAMIQAGLPQPRAVIADRRAAIEFAIQQAAPNDVVCVAGKGHEDYQEVMGQRHPFLDAAVVQTALQQRFGVDA
jgi:UDP-N-acetylmuramoyl-L-alanyl-D-glutamate--2,6-diaminopimelate ligase